MVQLLDLPTEILSEIPNHLEYLVDLNALIRTSRFFHTLLNTRLYRRICRDPSPLPWISRQGVLDRAADKGNPDCVRRLLQARLPHEALVPAVSPRQALLNTSHPIMHVAAGGHAEVVRSFIEHGVDPNPPTGFYGRSPIRFGNPLTEAIRNGQESVVRLLIDHGVDLEYDSRIRDALQPLSLAASQRQVSIAKLLLDQGCNPLTPNNSTNVLDENAFTVAALKDLEILKLFINAGIDPHTAGRPNLWSEALDGALKKRDMAYVTFLLDHVIGPKVVDDPGSVVDPRFQGVDVYTNFSHSAAWPEIGQLLLQAIDLDALLESESGPWIPLGYLMLGAAASGNEPLMDRLLRADLPSKHRIDPEEWLEVLDSCLYRAIDWSRAGIVNQLLDHGVDPNGMDYHAGIGNQLPDRGADPNDFDVEGSITTPILKATHYGRTEMVALLLDRGADPAPPGQPLPWTLALRDLYDSPEKLAMVRLLIERNLAVTEESTIDHDKLILTAVHGGETVFDLIRQHLQVTLQPECKAHRAAFTRAVVLGDTAIVKQFLDAGFDPNFCAENGGEENRRLWLLAHAARGQDHKTVEQTVDLLLEHGADLEARDRQKNMTPLLMLVDSRSMFFRVRILLKKGADVFCTCRKGETPLVKAARQGSAIVVQIFIKFFKQQNIPFDRVKDMVLTAARWARGWDIARILWRYYWPRVYPCPQN